MEKVEVEFTDGTTGTLSVPSDEEITTSREFSDKMFELFRPLYPEWMQNT